MSNFYTIHKAIIDTLEGCNLVNKVTFGNASDIDNDRDSVYPLCHVVHGGVDIQMSAETGTKYQNRTVTIYFLDIVAEDESNVIDVYNTTDIIATYFLQNIDLQGNSATLEIVDKAETNGLDGWKLTLNYSNFMTTTVC